VKIPARGADIPTMRKSTPKLERVRHQLKMLEFTRDHGRGWRLEDAARYAALCEAEREMAKKQRK
jgi:hypothetical protein